MTRLVKRIFERNLGPSLRDVVQITTYIERIPVFWSFVISVLRMVPIDQYFWTDGHRSRWEVYDNTSVTGCPVVDRFPC